MGGTKRDAGGQGGGGKRQRREPVVDWEALEKALQSLKPKFREQMLGASKASYNGGGIKLGGGAAPKSLKASQKFEINRIGRTSGCHTCGKTPNDVWIADHIPPKNLNEKAVAHYWPKWKSGSYRFFPHCNSCAAKQSTLVGDLNKAAKKKLPFKKLSDEEQKQVHDTRLQLSIKGQKNDASEDQRDEIQDFGDSDGCHVCGTKIASTKFDADHVPPSEFSRSYMGTAMEILKLRVPKWQVRPQCKTCSRAQSAKVKALTNEVKAIMEDAGVTVYKE